MVAVFSTNITDRGLAEEIRQALLTVFPEAKINFDLEDCDRILRIVHETPLCQQAMQWMHAAGYACSSLPDDVPVIRKRSDALLIF